jgi:serine/threonine protein kinase
MSNESLDQRRTDGFGVGGSKDYMNTLCGITEYVAPEVIQGLPYSCEVDRWSFGIMLYEMLSGIVSRLILGATIMI